jgi:predicted RNase H-like nuclease
MGIDGCRAGWLGVSLDSGPGNFVLMHNEQELKTILNATDIVFIDVPIGLEESRYTRMCDELLRRVLGKGYHSSVFSPPIRPALLTNDYAAACAISESKTGKRISKQAWNITPKIKTVDVIIRENKVLKDRVLESHPELLFKKLNRGGAPLPKKKTKEGIEKRLNLLAQLDDRTKALFNKMRKQLLKKQAKDDDLLDALVLGLYANRALTRPVRTLPVPPDIDAAGLPMAIHFL